MSRSVLGQPISKRQRGSFGEASLLLGHLIDSASRLKPHIFRWRSFSASPITPSFTCAEHMASRAKISTTAASAASSSSNVDAEKNDVSDSEDAGGAESDTGAAADRPVTPPPKTKRGRPAISSRVCGVCERIFSSRSAVRRHLVTHTGHRPFSCTVCGRRFSLKGNLMAHYLTHSGAKPFECHLCPQVFSQRCSLNRHLRRTHGTGAK
ncbi:uncharacterized protein LOC119161971 [Rhipicephalus microplus]|uniref:uncharacterized protein LOC119161971 n=1 Tax=Rhipicephalus microplus TaxID=6941 RepID=UPI003F6C1E68